MAGGDNESGRNGGGKSRKMGEIKTALPSMNTFAEEGRIVVMFCGNRIEFRRP